MIARIRTCNKKAFKYIDRVSPGMVQGRNQVVFPVGKAVIKTVFPSGSEKNVVCFDFKTNQAELLTPSLEWYQKLEKFNSKLVDNGFKPFQIVSCNLDWDFLNFSAPFFKKLVTEIVDDCNTLFDDENDRVIAVRSVSADAEKIFVFDRKVFVHMQYEIAPKYREVSTIPLDLVYLSV